VTASVKPGEAGRIVGVIVCAAIAAMTPFIAGAATALLGIVPLGCALWLVARAPWSRSVQLFVSLAVVAGTVGLAFVFLLIATATSGD
jgi:hypothetical protein